MTRKTFAIALCAGLAAASAGAQETAPVQMPPERQNVLIGQLGEAALPALLALLAVGALGSGGGS